MHHVNSLICSFTSANETALFTHSMTDFHNDITQALIPIPPPALNACHIPTLHPSPVDAFARSTLVEITLLAIFFIGLICKSQKSPFKIALLTFFFTLPIRHSISIYTNTVDPYNPASRAEQTHLLSNASFSKIIHYCNHVHFPRPEASAFYQFEDCAETLITPFCLLGRATPQFYGKFNALTQLLDKANRQYIELRNEIKSNFKTNPGSLLDCAPYIKMQRKLKALDTVRTDLSRLLSAAFTKATKHKNLSEIHSI